MKSLSIAVFLVAVAAASAGLHAGLLGGPAVIGPAGAIITSGVSHGAVIAGVPGLGGGIIAPGLALGHGLVGSGIEGQYVHDFTETLYDDGSYKPHVYGH